MLLRLLFFALALPAFAAEWSVPLAGNTYQTQPGPGRVTNRQGQLPLRDPAAVYSCFFHVNRPAKLDLALRAAAPEGGATWKVDCAGESFEVKLDQTTPSLVPIGQVQIKNPGYIEVKMSGLKSSGPHFGVADQLLVRSEPSDLKLDYVKTNQGNMFYWGRRGPSVHLNYALPRQVKSEWAYSELTVPEGEDPMGSYFMANGFSCGYFGIQVKSPTERWVLFSVWSPFHTNNPQDIPEADRVRTLAKGEGVQAQKFGGEGSGGQSFLRYPWEAGKTYRFLTRVQPNDDNTTTFTAWFGDKEADEWRLIASFQRPRTNTHLQGFHSFLENFLADHGAQQRMSLHQNQWVCDTEGRWHELTRARFTADNTGRGGHRLDYAGGVKDGQFFMKNGGFFNDRVPFDQWFERPAKPEAKPNIDFKALPGLKPTN